MSGPSLSSHPKLEGALHAFDRAFAEGRAEALAELFAEDAELLIHQQDRLIGRDAIRAYLRDVSQAFDTSAYAPSYEIVDVQGDRAYVVASFEETLRPRDGQPTIRIHGRAVHFWRRGPDGAWRITMLLTARSAPEETEG